jgi:predicted TIM-barrel fold metal-dependent hydrolase
MRDGFRAFDADTHVNPAADVLDRYVYASDYPHSECQFPNSVDNVLRWSSLKPDTKRKLLWDNAARFYKQT